MPGDFAMYAASLGQLDIQPSTTTCIRVSLRSHFLGWRTNQRSQVGSTAAVLRFYSSVNM